MSASLPLRGTVLPVALGMLALLSVPAVVAREPARTEVARSGTAMQVRSIIEAPVAVDLCFAVLADFDRLADFIPGMQSSHIVSPPGEPLRLRQTGRTAVGFLDYAFDVTLAVALDPPREITFSRVAGNIRRMEGSWNLRGDERHCRIDYQADIEPDFWVPPVVGPMLMRRQVEEQIDGLVIEIDRRAQIAATP